MNIEPCPYCGRKIKCLRIGEDEYQVGCSACGYRSVRSSKQYAVDTHNQLCRDHAEAEKRRADHAG